MIDPNINNALIEVAANLSALAMKGTATMIRGKIESVRQEKDTVRIREAYEEMITQLLEERADAIRIAQTYQEELERVTISDDEIEYLQKAVSKAIDIFKDFSRPVSQSDDPIQQAKANASIDALDSLKDLLCKELFKTMQLLGFNFKTAIGEPLTNLCANYITSIGKEGKKRK